MKLITLLNSGWMSQPTTSSLRRTLLLAGLGLALISAGCSSSPGTAAAKAAASSNAAKPASAPAAAKVSPISPTSVFHANLATGHDPFFPGMSRVATQSSGNSPSFSRLPSVSYLKLSGLRAGKYRPLALINKIPLAPGEESDISIVVSNQLGQSEVQKLNVRCLEVRPDSVLISIDGEQGVKELRMAQGK